MKGELRQKWDIWMEGFAATGESGQASYEGKWVGETFAVACENWATTEDAKLFNKERLTYWGCRLFNNEADARKLFG